MRLRETTGACGGIGTLAVASVLCEPGEAPATITAALADATASRDAASSFVLVAGAVIEALPAPWSARALAAALPRLVAWATSPFHTTRLLAQIVISHLATAIEDTATNDDGVEADGGGTRDVLRALADFFASQPQCSAAAAAATPLLRLPRPRHPDAAVLCDIRATALAAGAGDGESAPPSTAEGIAHAGQQLVETWRRQGWRRRKMRCTRDWPQSLTCLRVAGRAPKRSPRKALPQIGTSRSARYSWVVSPAGAWRRS